MKWHLAGKALSLWTSFGCVVASLFLDGCSTQKSQETTQEKFRVALVLDKGGIDDKSFNASAFAGAQRAERELGVKVNHVEVLDDTQLEPTLKNFAEKKFDLIISVGYVQQEALDRAAKAFPHSSFAIVDAVVDQPNVRSLMFKEHEGSYLAGAAAALKSKTGIIGFVGGMDIPLIRRFEYGYRQGAEKVNPKIKVLLNYVGVTGEAWNNPTRGKELALSQIQKGADVIYHAAGASGLGVFDAVEEQSQKQKRSLYAIGVDSNQNHLKPGLILTSMLKRVDESVFDTIRLAKEGKFQAGRIEYGLKDSGIDLAMDDDNKSLITDELRKELDLLRGQIVSGQIEVVDYYLLKTK